MTTAPPITAAGQALQNAAVVVSLKACEGWGWFQADAAKTLDAIVADVLETMPIDGDMTAIRLKIAEFRALKKVVFTDIEQMSEGAASVMNAVAGDDLPENHTAILP